MTKSLNNGVGFFANYTAILPNHLNLFFLMMNIWKQGLLITDLCITNGYSFVLFFYHSIRKNIWTHSHMLSVAWIAITTAFKRLVLIWTQINRAGRRNIYNSVTLKISMVSYVCTILRPQKILFILHSRLQRFALVINLSIAK